MHAAAGGCPDLEFDDGTSTSCTPTRCSSISAIPWRRCGMGRLCAPRVWSRSATRLRRDDIFPESSALTPWSTSTAQWPAPRGEPDAGRRLKAWALAAGFTDLATSEWPRASPRPGPRLVVGYWAEHLVQVGLRRAGNGARAVRTKELPRGWPTARRHGHVATRPRSPFCTAKRCASAPPEGASPTIGAPTSGRLSCLAIPWGGTVVQPRRAKTRPLRIVVPLVVVAALLASGAFAVSRIGGDRHDCHAPARSPGVAAPSRPCDPPAPDRRRPNPAPTHSEVKKVTGKERSRTAIEGSGRPMTSWRPPRQACCTRRPMCRPRPTPMPAGTPSTDERAFKKSGWPARLT